ncbi:MAG: hypothetical protein LBD52_03980 [Prevotellaceae bacterium]|jgi:hypothetical protein|nr:hypothetical protein [Prevotellaceae bacterium]
MFCFVEKKLYFCDKIKYKTIKALEPFSASLPTFVTYIIFTLRRLMYHTQEKRSRLLNAPVMCNKCDAWLGDGYYFWNDEIDALHWGGNSKRKTGYFEIYSATISCENILDTVFNEEHYKFWIKQIEKAAKYIIKKTNIKPTISEINQYFKEKAKWENLTDGIMFQDLPHSTDLLVINFNYRKRIQLVAYKLKIIHNFALHATHEV